MIRPLPESLIPVFQEKLGANNFEMLHGLSVSEMVDTFQAVVNAILCQTFPEKQIVISPYDDPWFNEELRKLKRQKQRQYECHGKNAKYDKLQAKFDEKLKNEKLKYIQKIENEVREGRKGSTYPALKRLGARHFETTKSGFQLPEHAELNLSSAQSAELIAEHFSRISQEFEPLNTSLLPPNVQLFLSNYDPNLAPKLSTSDVYSRIMKAKKPNGIVPGDLPKKLVQHCATTISVLANIIFNKITLSANFPTQMEG